MSTPVNPYIFLVCLWPFGFYLLWAIWNSFRDSRDEKMVLQSLDWPEVDGRVTSSKTVWAHIEINYEYSVHGARYQGKYKMNLTPVMPDKTSRGATQLGNEARRDLSEFPSGQKLVIRYNPARPEESVFFCSGKTDPCDTQLDPEFHFSE